MNNNINALLDRAFFSLYNSNIMKTYITSDLHLGHANIMKFCPTSRARFNNDVDCMNETIVAEWNQIVQPEDRVYILGDVAFMSANVAASYLARMNGTKILIVGNHDSKLLKDPAFRGEFLEIHKYYDLRYNGHFIVMSHFPFLEWDRMHRGSLHFYGHVHGDKTGHEQYRCMDVGMDATGVVVMNLDDAIAKIANNEIKGHHV